MRLANSASDDFGDDQLLICPPRVEGYALSNKMWVYLDVSADSLHEVPEMHEGDDSEGQLDIAFNKIVLPDDKHWKETKQVIEQLVRAHGSLSPPMADDNDDTPAPFKDFIEGKGEGLVVLLYGKSISVLVGQDLNQLN